MLRSFLPLVLAATTSTLAAGCWVDDTSGEQGELEFSYAGNGLFDCLFGCGLDQPIAVGATATIFIDDDHEMSSFSVRAPDGVSTEYSETFECQIDHGDDDFESRTVAYDVPCKAGEKRTVSRSVEVFATKAGTFSLSFYDEKGELVDEVELEASEAVSAEIHTQDSSDAADPIVLSTSEDVWISASFLDADGRTLYFDDVNYTYSIDDDSIATVADPAIINLSGATSTTLTPVSSGETTLHFESLGVESSVSVVVP